MAVNLFHDWPGVAGLYIAGAYCGALSTVSSGINSMATVIITDFIKTWSPKFDDLNVHSVGRFNIKLTVKFYDDLK